MTDIIERLGDTSKYDAVRTLKLVNPDDRKPLDLDGKPIEVDHVGAESADFREARHANQRILNDRAIAGEPWSPEIDEENATRGLAYCIKGWRGVPVHFLKGDGCRDELEFSRDNALAVMKRLPWFRAQVAVAIGKRENLSVTS